MLSKQPFRLWTAVALRCTLNLSIAAFFGGLIATYAGLMATPDALASTPLFPFNFALGILIFTIPGAFWVASVFRLMRLSWSPVRSYSLAIICGAVTGGAILCVLSPTSSEVFFIGAYFGFVTASVWAGLNRYVLPAF